MFEYSKLLKNLYRAEKTHADLDYLLENALVSRYTKYVNNKISQ